MLTIIDYSMGNLHSVGNALDRLGVPYRISASPEALESADGLILPGVGAFPDAVRCLKEGLFGPLRARPRHAAAGHLSGDAASFETGLEHSRTGGLGLIAGEVVPIDGHGEKIPHRLEQPDLRRRRPDTGRRDGRRSSLVHSFRAQTAPAHVLAHTFYGEPIPAVVRGTGNVYGMQFHPEKSHDVGLRLLANFCKLTENGGTRT
ncbi:MAG: imidazole glycerol phosphate synthase subunit HisH [Acutalibacteraceae bacterium]